MRIESQRGLLAARVVQALAIGKGNRRAAHAYAAGAGPQWREAEKALVDPLNSTTGGVLIGPAGADLMSYVWPLSVIGRLAGLRRVPLATRMLSEDVAVGAGFVDEYSPIPVYAESLASTMLDGKPKVGSACVLTRELVESSDPAALDVIRTALGKAGASALDKQFIDPAQDAGTGTTGPASVTAGATPINSTGETLAQIDADLAAAMDALIDGGSDLTAAAWVLPTRSAAYMSRLRGSGGALAYPGLTAKGGTLLGLPAIASGSVPVSNDTAASTTITLVDAAQVWFGSDVAGISVSEQAAVALDSEPAGVTPISLWQRDLVGVRLLLFANWRLARARAVQLIDDIAY